MRITELRDKLISRGEPIEDKERVINTLNGLPPYWESFIQISVDAPSFLDLTDYGQIALRVRRGLQQDKYFMALNLRRINHSWRMLRKGRKGEKISPP